MAQGHLASEFLQENLAKSILAKKHFGKFNLQVIIFTNFFLAKRPFCK